MGYEIQGEANVLSRHVLQVQGPTAPGFRMDLELSNRWLEAALALNEIPDQHHHSFEQILNGIQAPHGFASILVDDRPVALCLTVIDRGWMGIYDVVTAKEVRRQGLGHNLMLSAMKWGLANGATNVYLQVMTNNPPAIELYKRLQFTERYKYWYRVKSST